MKSEINSSSVFWRGFVGVIGYLRPMTKAVSAYSMPKTAWCLVHTLWTRTATEEHCRDAFGPLVAFPAALADHSNAADPSGFLGLKTPCPIAFGPRTIIFLAALVA